MDHYNRNTLVFLGCLSDKASAFKTSLWTLVTLDSGHFGLWSLWTLVTLGSLAFAIIYNLHLLD